MAEIADAPKSGSLVPPTATTQARSERPLRPGPI